MKKFLFILGAGILWCNTSIAQIINIDNKITLDLPKHHKYTELQEDDVFYGEYFFDQMFEPIEMFEPKVFMSGSKNLIDLIEDVRDGKDPMENKYIATFMRKMEKKSTSLDELKFGKWMASEIKKTFKKAKIDFSNFIVISGKKIDDIDTSDLGFDINDFQEMNNTELKRKTKEIRANITEDSGDNKTIDYGPTRLVIKKFKIAKNEYNQLFMIGEAKIFMAVNETLSIDGNYVLFVIVKDDRAFAIFSECFVDCSEHGKKIDKMIKPMFSTTTKIVDTDNNATTSNDSNIVDQIQQLNELYKSGALTKEEFEKAKKKLLN